MFKGDLEGDLKDHLKGDLKGDFEVDLEVDLEGDFRGDFKQDFRTWKGTCCQAQVSQGPGQVRFTAKLYKYFMGKNVPIFLGNFCI